MARDELHTLYASDMDYVPFRRKNTITREGDISMVVPDEPVILHAKLIIPGYGFMWVYADNCGKGYRSGADIEFTREAAVSRAYDVEREIGKGGFTPSAKCMSMLKDAQALLKMAESNAANAPDYNITALAAGLWAGELVAVERARARIAANGKRNDFLFGCGGFDYPYTRFNDGKKLFDSVFNFATLPFYLAH